MKFAPGIFLMVPLLAAGSLSGAFAQNATAAPRNLIPNGGFESSSKREIPWDGINRSGLIEMNREGNTANILTASGTVASSSMPASVSVGDLNGDGLSDLLVSDPLGYMFVFFNKGTPAEAKFGAAELIPVFLTRSRLPGDPAEIYRAQRVHLGDISRSGKLDIWVGNYIGEIMRIPNAGGGAAPDFRQPRAVQQLLIPTASTARRWGNVFAPALWDFNSDGKTDLLVGEGSYSANSVHILLNEGSNSQPKFSDTNRHVLAFGMGREQLTPAVVDYDGDGNPDLLVADHSGKIGVYSSSMTPSGAAAEDKLLAGIPNATGGKWKPGEHLPFIEYIKGESGSELSFGGLPTVSAGDLNGDGLFDVVVGKTNGRVAIAYNKGTKTAPKFATPEEIKTDANSPGVDVPSAWEISTGLTRGNFLGYAAAVTAETDPQAQPVEKTKALKLAYMPNSNKIIRSPFAWSGWIGNPPKAGEGDPFNKNSAANLFGLRQRGRVDPDKTYILSFKYKGTGVSNPRVRFSFDANARLSEAKETKDERGRIIKRQGGDELRGKGGDENANSLSVSGNWTEFKKEYRIVLDNKELMDYLKEDANRRRTPVQWTLNVAAELAPGTGALYFDDFQLIEKQ